jgi:nucleoside-diphosphate-sugar epimerase
VAATLFLLEKTKPGIDYFNYSDEPQLTTREIIETIYKYADRDMPRLKIPVTFASILAAPFDLLEMISGRLFPITAKRIKKFNTETFYQANKIREIGFKQPIFLEEGFKRTLEWFREKNDKYHRI